MNEENKNQENVAANLSNPMADVNVGVQPNPMEGVTVGTPGTTAPSVQSNMVSPDEMVTDVQFAEQQKGQSVQNSELQTEENQHSASSFDNAISDLEQQPVVTVGESLPELKNGGALLTPIQSDSSANGSSLLTKAKASLDYKKLIIVGIVALIALMLGLSIFGYKVVSCKGEEEVSGATVTVEVKAYFWFGKVNKMVTIKTIDLSKMNKESKDEVIKLFEDNSDENNVQITENKIVTTVTTRPENAEEADITENDVIKAYEKYNFVCK